MVFVIFVVLVGVSAVGEYQGNPLVNSILGSEQHLEGKESDWLGRAAFGQSLPPEPCVAVTGCTIP